MRFSQVSEFKKTSYSNISQGVTAVTFAMSSYFFVILLESDYCSMPIPHLILDIRCERWIKISRFSSAKTFTLILVNWDFEKSPSFLTKNFCSWKSSFSILFSLGYYSRIYLLTEQPLSDEFSQKVLKLFHISHPRKFRF